MEETRSLLAFAVWMAFVLSGLYLFASRNVERKLRWWRPYNIAGAVLFLGVMFAWGFPLVMLCIAAMFVAITTSRNLRRPPPFCTNCGATVWNRGLFLKTSFCPQCGAQLPGTSPVQHTRSPKQ